MRLLHVIFCDFKIFVCDFFISRKVHEKISDLPRVASKGSTGEVINWDVYIKPFLTPKRSKVCHFV